MRRTVAQFSQPHVCRTSILPSIYTEMRPPCYSANDNQNYFVKERRTSSRVLQEPGGRSSINLSWGGDKQDEDIGKSVSNNFFANSNRMNSGNIISDRPSSRVLKPPGGSSTINLC